LLSVAMMVSSVVVVADSGALGVAHRPRSASASSLTLALTLVVELEFVGNWPTVGVLSSEEASGDLEK
jgi:hypothetical protein